MPASSIWDRNREPVSARTRWPCRAKAAPTARTGATWPPMGLLTSRYFAIPNLFDTVQPY